MIKHGISTTKAHYWVHLFPLSYKVFWYPVVLCRNYISLHNLPQQIGRSKDGTPTGAGFLVPQSAYFVSGASVTREYLNDVDWRELTDREAGLRGQDVVLALIEHRHIAFPPFILAPLNSRDDQYSGVDCELRWRVKPKIEIKTERATTQNLFVQHQEGGHRVHLTPNGQYRASDIPLFEDGDKWP